MNTNQKGNSRVAIIGVFILVIIAVVFLLSRNTTLSTPLSQNQSNQSEQAQSIQTDNDLMSASSDLDNTDLNSMDNELSQNDSETSSF